jgi:type VI secretion system protein ImpK
MTDRAYRVCSDLLLLAAKFPFAPSLPAAGELRERLQAALDNVIGRGRAAGLTDPDLVEIRYALVAFIDAQLLKSNWPGRAEWMQLPLEVELYQRFSAGEDVFKRMSALIREGNRQDALSIYALCLLLGFRGKYAATPDHAEPTRILEDARRELARKLPRSDRIGPHAEPGQRMQKRRTSNLPLIAFIVGGLLLAFAIVVGFERAVSADVERVVDTLPATMQQVPLKE